MLEGALEAASCRWPEAGCLFYILLNGVAEDIELVVVDGGAGFFDAVLYLLATKNTKTDSIRSRSIKRPADASFLCSLWLNSF